MTRLAELADSRELIVNLTMRELRGKYKRSFLGWGWSLLNPALWVAIYGLVFGVFLEIQPPVGDPSGLESFVLFLVCGLMPWTFFQAACDMAPEMLIANGNLIKKLYFPRQVLVVSAVYTLLLTFLIEIGVVAVLLLVVGNMVLPWLPVVALIALLQTIFVLGIAFVLSVLNVYFRDVKHLAKIATQALFYATPIVYTIKYVPKQVEVLGVEIPLRDIYELNPLVRMVGLYRSALYDLSFPAVGDLLVLRGVGGRAPRVRLVGVRSLRGPAGRGSMTNPAAAITVSGVSKRYRLYHERNDTLKASLMRHGRARYEEFWALRDVSFEVPQGKAFGIVGENGSGKSTMLKCMARILRPEVGSIQTRGKVSALLELGAGFHPELSGRDNVFLNGSLLGLGKRQLNERFDDIVAFAGLEQFIDSPVKNYSSGMYMRLGFSVAINVDPDILLVDEVLAVGDTDFQRRCLRKLAELRAGGATVVLVTHTLATVRELLRRGRAPRARTPARPRARVVGDRPVPRGDHHH